MIVFGLLRRADEEPPQRPRNYGQTKWRNYSRARLRSVPSVTPRRARRHSASATPQRPMVLASGVFAPPIWVKSRYARLARTSRSSTSWLQLRMCLRTSKRSASRPRSPAPATTALRMTFRQCLVYDRNDGFVLPAPHRRGPWSPAKITHLLGKAVTEAELRPPHLNHRPCLAARGYTLWPHQRFADQLDASISFW